MTLAELTIHGSLDPRAESHWYLPQDAATQAWYFNATTTSGTGRELDIYVAAAIRDGGKTVALQSAVRERGGAVLHRGLHLSAARPELRDDGLVFEVEEQSFRVGPRSATVSLASTDGFGLHLDLSWDEMLLNWGSGRYPFVGGWTTQFSIPKATGVGVLMEGDRRTPIEVTGWLDRQWLDAEIGALTWFGLVLDNGFQISLLQTTDTGGVRACWATVLRPDGSIVLAADITISAGPMALDPETGATMPSSWTLEIPSIAATVSFGYRSVADFGAFRVGAGSAVGAIGDQPVTGRVFIDVVGVPAGVDEE